MTVGLIPFKPDATTREECLCDLQLQDKLCNNDMLQNYALVPFNLSLKYELK